jgi:hypothetical protein
MKCEPWAGCVLIINDTEQLSDMGSWYPVVIDIVVQSYALGLVGTEDSTFSLVSQLRVLDWNGGVVRSVNMRDK